MEWIITLKLLATLGMFVIGLFPALLPMLVPLCCRSENCEDVRPISGRTRHSVRLTVRGKKFVSALACFGAGVFVAAFFLDMIGEVREAFHKWFASMCEKCTPDAIRAGYPWPEFCAVMGFLAVLFMEQVVMYFHSRRHVHVRRSHSTQVPEDGGGNLDSVETLNAVTIVIRSHEPTQIMPLNDESSTKLTAVLPLALVDPAAPNNTDKFLQLPPSMVFPSNKDLENHTDLKSVMRAIILLLALCFHSIFEGVAIGLSKQPLPLFAGVCMHKGIEAFCLGLNIAQSGIRPFLVVLFDVLFALMSPLGIVIGMTITELEETPLRHAVTAILQGLASGTFLYCAFIEILPKELLKDEMVAHDHDHSNVFLEEITQRPDSSITSTNEDGKPAEVHARTLSHNNSSEQVDKLIKCMAFAVGIAVMAVTVALDEHLGKMFAAEKKTGVPPIMCEHLFDTYHICNRTAFVNDRG